MEARQPAPLGAGVADAVALTEAAGRIPLDVD
jgi:hypothetical protein